MSGTSKLGMGKNVCISNDRWEEYVLDERRQNRIKEVHMHLKQGLLTQDKIFERLTEMLVDREREPAIGGHFDRLARTSTGCITKESLFSSLATLVGVDGWDGSDGNVSPFVSGLFFDMIRWHAAFPFPLTCHDGQHFDKAGFARAVSILSKHDLPTHDLDIRYGEVTGTLGPHDGWIIVTRRAGGGGEDWRRRIFRSLAVTPDSHYPFTDTERPPYVIAVPRFLVIEEVGPPEGTEPSDDPDDDYRTTVWLHDEDERTVDLRDVLSYTAPVEHRISGRPMRESYDKLVASGMLPTHKHSLAELAVSRRSLGELVAFLAGRSESIKGKSSELGIDGAGLSAWANELRKERATNNDGVLGWNAFNAALAQNENEFRNSLGRLFAVFLT
ncbi:hypothetical protein PspLS_00101 [Pyricularia sp. CBS 133598]|nr:hypothetical protein PspLS_00101 [Pyricularia sp. CBS 133598]